LLGAALPVAANDALARSVDPSSSSDSARARPRSWPLSGALPASGPRRLITRRVCVRTSSVRSRSVTSSGVAKKIDE
jgi:hypothetical protein